MYVANVNIHVYSLCVYLFGTVEVYYTTVSYNPDKTVNIKSK